MLLIWALCFFALPAHYSNAFYDSYSGISQFKTCPHILVLKGIFDVVGHVIVTGWYWVKEGQEPKESFA